MSISISLATTYKCLLTERWTPSPLPSASSLSLVLRPRAVGVRELSDGLSRGFEGTLDKALCRARRNWTVNWADGRAGNGARLPHAAPVIRHEPCPVHSLLAHVPRHVVPPDELLVGCNIILHHVTNGHMWLVFGQIIKYHRIQRRSYIKTLDTVHHAGIRLSTGAFMTSLIPSLSRDAGEPPLSVRRNYLMLNYVASILLAFGAWIVIS
jgi:hypothetical protein